MGTGCCREEFSGWLYGVDLESGANLSLLMMLSLEFIALKESENVKEN